MSNKTNDALIDNIKDRDYELHEQAGLVDAGEDPEGLQLWIGTNSQWQKYEELYNKEFNN
jgi:hypothetical protein